MHQLQPAVKGGGRKNRCSQEQTLSLKQQLPSADELLADAGTLEVLREYFPNFKKLGAVFQTHHSKRVNIYWYKGVYLVKDFTGKEFGDDDARNVLQVLQFYHHFDFREALVLLAAKLGYASTAVPAPLNRPVPRPIAPAGTEKEPESIRVDAQFWDRITKNFRSKFHLYALSLGVTEQHLRRWNVGTDNRGNTVFGHQDITGSYVNLKHFAFLSSGSRDKSKKPFYLKNPAGKKYGQCLYGIHLLREGVPVVLVESEKTANLCSFFYPQYDFVATGGASSLSKEKAKALKGKFGYVLVDPDSAGRQLSSWRMLLNHGLDFTPVDLFSHRHDGYDIADALRDGLRPNIADWRFQLKPSSKVPDYRLHVNRYIGEQAAHLVDYIQHHGKVLLKARTGTGKTTFALEELASRVRGRVVIVEPLTVIVDAIAKSKHGEIAIIKQGATQEDVQTALHSKITVCTYDSFAKIAPVSDDDLIICDEVHELLSGYGMPDKRSKYEFLFKQLLEAKNVLCISATPPGFLKDYGFKYVEVTAGQSNKIQLTPITYKGKVQHELARLLPTLDFKNHQYLIRLNNLKLIEQVVGGFKGLSSEQVAVLSSDTKAVAGGAYQSITDSKQIPESLRLVFTTSLVDCGVDLYNQHLRVIMVEHENEYLSVSNALQFMARARMVPLLPVTVYKLERKRKDFDSEAAYQAIRRFSHQECQDLNRLNTHYQELSPYLPKGSYSYRETAKYCCFNKTTQQYEVNELLIHFEVEQAAIQKTATDDFFRQLEKEGHIIMADSQQVKVEKTIETEELDRAAKANKKHVEEQALALLETGCTTAIYTALHHVTKDFELRKQIVRIGYDVRMNEEANQLQEINQKLLSNRAALHVLKNYLKLQERHIDPGEIVALMREHKGSRKFGDLLNRLDTLNRIKFFEHLSPADKRDVERIISHKQAIEREVTESKSINNKTGNRVTAETITALMNRNRDKAIKLTKEKAMRLFHILFETDVVVVKENGKTVKYFGIVADNTKALH
ncbi:DUF6371 domain-containing protein [Pontibacter sp. H249]|uniref:DUF6371 domain-containing protein n=1 Tax=Pontibacter sp. H249 TaxID=3133420 RepID=UPI0030C0E37B